MLRILVNGFWWAFLADGVSSVLRDAGFVGGAAADFFPLLALVLSLPAAGAVVLTPLAPKRVLLLSDCYRPTINGVVTSLVDLQRADAAVPAEDATRPVDRLGRDDLTTNAGDGYRHLRRNPLQAPLLELCGELGAPASTTHSLGTPRIDDRETGLR